MKIKDIVYLSIITLLIITIIILITNENASSEDAVENKEKVSELFSEGKKLYEAEDQEKALEVFTKCIEIDDKFADAYEYRGHCYYYFAPMDPPKYEKFLLAYEDFKKALELDSSKEHLRKLIADSLVSYVEFSLRFSTRPISVENFREAFELLSKAIDIAPNYSMPYRQRGAMIVTTAYNLAKDDIYRAIELGDTSYYNYDNIALLHYRLGDIDKSIRVLEKALEKNNTSHSLWTSLGIYYLKDSNIKKAEEVLVNALKYCSEDHLELLKERINEFRVESKNK